VSHQLQGLFVPVTTPFDDDGEVDLERFAEQIRIYTGYGLSGVIVFGTSGEGPLLEAEEEPTLLDVARRAVPKDWKLIVQVGRESVRASCTVAERASAAGADALLCLPPRYYALSEAVITNHFRAIHAATQLPLLAYHFPVRSKVDLPADLLIELGREGTISGIKDSAGDLALQESLRRALGPDFAILCGKASVVAEALAAVADGAILAVADAAPETVLALFDAHRANDAREVVRIQTSLLPLAEACGPKFGIAGIKAALDARGWPGGGEPRAPLLPLGNGDRELVIAALRTAGIQERLTSRGRPYRRSSRLGDRRRDGHVLARCRGWRSIANRPPRTLLGAADRRHRHPPYPVGDPARRRRFTLCCTSAARCTS
jgi:dihydrodipicolinate synthase/N-acetylneuraminate lyase